jgi:prophage maintenance system killer protein
MASAFGEDAYPTLASKAAALLESLVRNHGLVDGNKRSAGIATWLFLRLNGLRLPPAPDAYDLVIAIGGAAPSSTRSLRRSPAGAQGPERPQLPSSP